MRTYSTGDTNSAMFRLSRKVTTGFGFGPTYYYEITSSAGYGLDTRETERYFKRHQSTAGFTSEYVVDHNYETIKWYVNNLTVGNTYRFFVEAKHVTSSSNSSLYLYAGGSQPPCIIKGYFV